MQRRPARARIFCQLAPQGARGARGVLGPNLDVEVTWAAGRPFERSGRGAREHPWDLGRRQPQPHRTQGRLPPRRQAAL